MKENRTMSAGNLEGTTPVCDAMRAKGDWNPAWDQFAQLDPVWTERFMAMAATPIAKGVLDPKVYEFLAIAVDASCTHMYAPGVRRHIRKALELGATKEEILAVLQCVSVLGIHSCSLGVPILVEELSAASGQNVAGKKQS
jgi:alkylhydroperoxidase/carboxymuconolactone decarboxylase family protein YurZ